MFVNICSDYKNTRLYSERSHTKFVEVALSNFSNFNLQVNGYYISNKGGFLSNKDIIIMGVPLIIAFFY